MLEFLGRAFGAFLSWAAGSLMRNVVVPGIVTLAMSLAFSGGSSLSDHPPSAPVRAQAVAENIPTASDWTKVSFDPDLVPPMKHFHARRPAGLRLRRPHSPAPLRVESTATTVPAALPIPEPARTPERVVTAEAASASGEALQASLADRHRFRLLGIAPVDLIPSPSRILRHVTHFGSSLAEAADDAF